MGTVTRSEAMEILQEQTQTVVKANSLIQNARYTLSTNEQKVVLYVISKIKPEDTELQTYKITIRDLCRVCGVVSAGNNYANFETCIKNISDNSFFIYEGKKKHLVRWIDRPTFLEEESAVVLQLDPRLRPYLLNLKQNFTQYEISNILAMKSKYSIRLYELLKSYAFIGEHTFSLEELKDMLQTAEYTVYNNFKVRVLDVAVEEINKYTELNVGFRPIRSGRKITEISFEIDKKEQKEQFTAALAKRKNLALKEELV